MAETIVAQSHDAREMHFGGEASPSATARMPGHGHGQGSHLDHVTPHADCPGCTAEKQEPSLERSEDNGSIHEELDHVHGFLHRLANSTRDQFAQEKSRVDKDFSELSTRLQSVRELLFGLDGRLDTTMKKAFTADAANAAALSDVSKALGTVAQSNNTTAAVNATVADSVQGLLQAHAAERANVQARDLALSAANEVALRTSLDLAIAMGGAANRQHNSLHSPRVPRAALREASESQAWEQGYYAGLASSSGQQRGASDVPPRTPVGASPAYRNVSRSTGLAAAAYENLLNSPQDLGDVAGRTVASTALTRLLVKRSLAGAGGADLGDSLGDSGASRFAAPDAVDVALRHSVPAALLHGQQSPATAKMLATRWRDRASADATSTYPRPLAGAAPTLSPRRDLPLSALLPPPPASVSLRSANAMVASRLGLMASDGTPRSPSLMSSRIRVSMPQTL